MKKEVLIIAIFMTILPMSGLAPDINIKVSDNISGYVEYFSFDNVTYSTPQHFLLEWMNSGSVACKVKIRADILRNNSLVYTGWSQEKLLKPGAYDSFDIYWIADEDGNYRTILRAYYCFESEKIKEVNFSAVNMNKTKMSSLENLADISITNTKDKIKVNIKKNRNAKEELPDIIIVPSDYPAGWYFTSGKFKPEKGKISGFIPYNTDYWKEEPITLEMISEDGKYYAKKTILLKKTQNYYLIYILAGLIILAIILNTLVRKPRLRRKRILHRKT